MQATTFMQCTDVMQRSIFTLPFHSISLCMSFSATTLLVVSRPRSEPEGHSTVKLYEGLKLVSQY